MMRLTRRNVLIVLGVLTVAGGALFGAGAFSQVTADRTVNAATAGDGSAYVQFEVNNSNYASINSDSELEVTLDSLNTNASTTVNHTFNVTFSGDASGTYDVYVVDETGVGSDAELDFIDESDGTTLVGSANAASVGETGKLSVGVHVDLRDGNSVDQIPAEFTVVVEQQ